MDVNRRGLLLGSAAAVGALTLPAFAQSETILLGVPSALSGPVGLADSEDWRNGVNLAVKQINAAGGVAGKMLEVKEVDIDLLTPEGTITAFQSLIEANVQAIISPFVYIAQPAMDAVAPSGIPYLHGNTQISSLDLYKSNPEKYQNVFQLDAAETWYGSGFIKYISDLKKSGDWTPKNNKVHIVREQLAYTQVISQTAMDAIAASNGEWELSGVTDIQYPVQDWTPVIAALRASDAGTIMINHWLSSELAAFTTAFQSDPVEGALVYLQYGPSQPDFLDLAGADANGFIWGTVYGVYADEKGQAFRDMYMAEYPGTMGLVYSGGGFDTVTILANIWVNTDPNDFKAVCDAIRKVEYRGVNGFYRFDPATQSGISYPNMTDDPEAGQAHLIFQVQDGQHKIISPPPYVETKLQPAPWW